MRSKYVDDTTAIEIIPRNSISILDLVVREIHDYCIEHKMKLNKKKCKEMYIHFIWLLHCNLNALERISF